MKFYILLLIVTLFSCSKKAHNCLIVTNCKYVKNDSLYPMHNVNNAECLKISKDFYDKAGLKISKYYEILDENQLDIDKDKSIDSLLVISPINKVPSNKLCEDEHDGNRILLIKTKNEIYLYDNIIWNKWGFAAHNADNIEEPCSERSGFSLMNYFGQGCFFEYNLCISISDKRLVIDSIKLRSGCQGKEVFKTIENMNKPFYIENYKTMMIDSLMDEYAL